mmetsp:Transcript_8937/g.18720  ORF Transcript_8937/g.18720 Transcript_8937/m.18720 type:complete len:193 (+) Transcript_8937:972-1550(+)
MREMQATGRMGNRARQNDPSFLIHDLGFDWRLGAAWLKEFNSRSPQIQQQIYHFAIPSVTCKSNGLIFCTPRINDFVSRPTPFQQKLHRFQIPSCTRQSDGFVHICCRINESSLSCRIFPFQQAFGPLKVAVFTGFLNRTIVIFRGIVTIHKYQTSPTNRKDSHPFGFSCFYQIFHAFLVQFFVCSFYVVTA